MWRRVTGGDRRRDKSMQGAEERRSSFESSQPYSQIQQMKVDNQVKNLLIIELAVYHAEPQHAASMRRMNGTWRGSR